MDPFLIAGGLVLGAVVVRSVFSSPPTGGGRKMSLPAVNKFVSILGRDTYIHAPPGATRVIVYFHGFGSSVRTMGPSLVSALSKSDSPVAIIIPQLGSKSEPYNLATQFVEYLAQAMSEAGSVGAHLDTVSFVSHSGGYQALADAMRQLPMIKSVALLDSLYGRYNDYLAYAKRGGCLIDLYGPTTTLLSERLRTETFGMRNVIIQQTTELHATIPEKFIASVANSLAKCQKVSGV